MIRFIEKHFNQLLLSAFVLYLIHVVLFMSIYVKSPETLSWAREMTSGFAGGLLGLITGVRLGQALNDPKDKDKKHE